MKTLDTAKLVVSVALGLGVTGWAASAYAGWKADLRFEGERAILIAQADTADRRAEALADSLAVVDSIRVADVERARQEAEADRERARRAEIEADRARQRTATVADSVVDLYGDTVRAAVEAVQAEHEVERNAWAARASALEQATARVTAALDTAEARIADRDQLLAAKDAQLALRDQIIERWERSGSGHGIVVDVLIGAGGVAVGAIGMAAAGG